MRLYGTHYRAAYLGMPDTDVEAYANAGLIPDAPNLRGELLLIHGLADDNVYAAHSLRMSGAHGSRPPPRVHPAERHHAPADRPGCRRACCRSRSTSCGGRSGSRGKEPRIDSVPAAAGEPPHAIIVQKYGGTSVASVEQIQAVADQVVRAREDGNDVVVVVSAMGHTTDELLAMQRDRPVPDPRELDMLLTAGERIAMSLLGIAINSRGCRAASSTGSQAGTMTDTLHGSARIVEIRPKRIWRRSAPATSWCSPASRD